MALTEFTIQGDKFNGKNLLLNLYFLTNAKSKFTDDDVKNLRLKNITTVNGLDLFLKKDIYIADFFVSLINDQAKIKKDKKGETKELYDILIRFKSITGFDDILDPNLSLTILGDIDPQIGIVNVKNIFLTAMEKEKQEFETMATTVVLEIADNFRIDEAKLRTIFDSNVFANMKFLISSFSEEKERWLQYLQFQSQNLEYKRNNSCLYLTRKLTEYIKIPKTVTTLEAFHDARFLAHNFWYVNKMHFANKNIKINPSFEEVIVIELELILEDFNKYLVLKGLNNLSIAGLQINRAYQKETPLTLFTFNFSDSYAQDGTDIYDLGFNITTTKEHQNPNLNVIKELMKLYMIENNITKEKEIDSETIKLAVDHLSKYQIISCFYEIKNDDDISLKELTNIIPQYGYLTYIGKGDSTLIRRSSVILDKISKNDVANPYLINYIFNIEDVKLKSQHHLITLEQLHFASTNLNLNQKKALVKALNSQDIFLLQGPPGTGKTEFIAELVYQYAKLGKKVLISSQNHTAIDNVLTRLYKTPMLVPLRLTGEEVRKKNRFNDFNPDKLIFNNYRFIYSHLMRQYLTKWNAIDYDYENQKKELQSLKARAKMLEQEIKDYNTWTQKVNELVAEQEMLGNQKLEYQKDNRRLKVDINNIDNAIEFLGNLNWEGIITSTTDLVELFNKYFGTLIQEKLGFQFDESYSLTNTYQQLLTESGPVNPLLVKKEQELTELKNVSQTFRDDAWIEKLQVAQNEILELKQQLSLKQENVVYQNLQREFKKDLLKLKGQYEKQINDNEKLINQIDVNKNEREISYLESDIAALNNRINTLKIEIENIVNSINHVFNLNLVVKDITATINEIDKVINSIDHDMKTIINEKATKGNFVNNMITFLDKNYNIADFLNQEGIQNDRFTSAMERDTVNYANQFLQDSVNVVAMTATSNQSYAQSKNKVLQDYNIADIDIKKFGFDVVVIDEVSKLTPMEIFMPLVYGKAVVLVGDYRQLPPIMPYREEDVALVNDIYNENYSYNDFLELVTNSMFKKIISKCDDSVKEILINQYRSHEDIMRIVNVFYENQLQLGDEINQNNEKQHYVTVENDKGLKIFDSEKAIYWIDSTKDENQNFVYEQGESGSTSLFNWLEINLTIKVLQLIELGYNNLTTKLEKQPKVAVISFYGLHVKNLRKTISNLKFKNIKVEVSTVDDYQGRETEIVIVNTVRHPQRQLNANKEFIKKYERLNVAFSRAKNMLIIIGAVNFFANIDVEIPTVINPNVTTTIKAYYEILRIINNYGLIWYAKDLLS
ncbi:superfamily I DNA/RNA helicase [Spiroplasma sp. NBRC 100390]|uniref:AAA domain-containing protein n=1 Tax=unclassified Spiroplasma TaxID=2637901 RepID=UPI0008928F3E|nr:MULTISPECIES: AAA domain-containing protein [unclassified Spiroplasma]AOX44332.1 superfamily I DNA/RNA helicase [Spiroplasma sp. TU-14]APE13802.1 superfamily I DNA/RNA helicase [Spiroplasma sp. NBRC 100390]